MDRLGAADALALRPAMSGIWLHVALMYLKPWRPTFLVMQRHPPYDRHSALGLQVVRNDTDQTILNWKTVWDVTSGMVDLEAEIVLSWHRFVSSSRTVFEIDPSKQRVEALDVPDVIVWRGKVHEGARKARKTVPKKHKPAQPKPPPANPGPTAAGNAIADAQGVDSDASVGSSAGSEGGMGPNGAPIDVADFGEVEAPQSSSDSDFVEDEAGGPAGEAAADPLRQPDALARADAQAAPADEEVVDIAGADIDRILEMMGADEPPNAHAAPVALPAPAAPQPAAPAPPLDVRRPPRQAAGQRRLAGAVVVLPGLQGMFRYYPATNSVVMHCAHHDDAQCRLTRTLNASALASRAGQGRPLGLLLAWATCCDPARGAAAHVHEFVPTLQQRQEARRRLHQLAERDVDLRTLLSFERPQRPGEPEEPATVK